MRLLVALLLSLILLPVQAARVAFISPGHADEVYWVGAIQAMQHAAADLDFELDVYHAERDPLRQIQLVCELTGDQRPDYLLVAADKGALVEQLRHANAMKLPTLAAYNAVMPSQREVLGLPRGRLPYWLGSVVPDAEEGGAMTAEALIRAGHEKGLADSEGRLHLLAFYGDRSSDTSIKRNRGMQRVVEQHPEVVLLQAVATDWRRDKAEQQAEHLLRRHPQVNLVWSGSDQVAFGVMDAARRQGRRPGEDLLFSGFNTSDEAMHSLIGGQLTTLAGGHFMAGAWGLVMIYDYHHGRDFAEDEGTELTRPMFSLFDPALARRYLSRRGGVDFRRFSKVHNPDLKHYDFSFAAFLRGHP